MRSDLEPVTIDQAVELIIDHRGRTPKKLGGDFAELGVQVISAKNVYDGRLHPGDNLRFVPPEMAARWMPTQLRDGDVLLTSEAPLGQVAYIDGDFGYCLGQRLFALRARPDVANGRFLYYTLISPQVQGRLHARATGTTVQGIKQSELRQIELELPDTAEQARIVSVLGALDDKIDSNRRLAILLEETAGTIFRARFVDFVGVEELEKSDTRGIPSGWRTGALSDLARFVNGKAFTKHSNNRGRPILRIKELNDCVSLNTPRSDIDAADEHVAHDRDILFAWSGSLDVYRWSGPESLINQHIFKVIPEGYPPWFVYQWTRQHMADFRAIARDKATTMGHIQRRHLSEAAVSIPDVAAISAARDALDPIDDQQGMLIGEIGTLRKLREVLLPRLISGEIRVPDTHDPEEVIGPAAERLAAATS
jgi:type I restriction enzyme, S subunit